MDNHNTTIHNCISIQLRCPIMANDLANAIHQHLAMIMLDMDFISKKLNYYSKYSKTEVKEMSTNSVVAIAKLEAIANALAGR